MPSLIDYIRKLQDVEYERSANVMMSAIAQMSKGQGSEVQALVTALEKRAKAITEAGKLVSSETYSQMLAGFRAEMNRIETLIKQTAPNIELSGARAANNSVTARLFYGTSQDMIEAGLDPTSAEAMAYFMQLVKDVGIPFEVPKPEDLVTKYSQSQEFYDHMDKWGDGYADYFDDAIRNGVKEGWSPAKIARYARDMATNIPVNAAYTWTRTLQLQSYRDASARMEMLNGRFIEKKIRIAALDGRTCPACIALHGTEVPKGKSIQDHYNGRCDAIYVPAGGEMPEYMQAMSTPGNRQFVEWQNGTDWFDAQSDAYKKQVLGAGRFDLYQQGKFKLDADFVKWHDDDVFGIMPGAKPLWQLQGFDSYKDKLVGISYTKDELEQALINYTGMDYKYLNKALRGETDMRPEYKEILDKLDIAFAENQETIDRTKLYRALFKSPDELGIIEGKIYSDSAFVSTTTSSKYMYKLNSPVRVTIKTSKNNYGVDLRDISKKKKESEILLNRNSKFKVLSVKKNEFGTWDVILKLIQD